MSFKRNFREKAKNKKRKICKICSIIFAIALMNSNIFSQESEDKRIISNDQYKLINSLYTKPSEKKAKFSIYHMTSFDKSWTKYFMQNDLDYILSNAGLPSTLTDEKIKNLFTPSIREKIISGIFDQSSLKIQPNKVNVKISSKIRNKEEANNIGFISKPIIIEDIGLLRVITENEGKIFIFKLIEKKWNIVLTIDEWVILVD